MKITPKHALVQVDYITATAKFKSQVDSFDIIAGSQMTEGVLHGHKVDAFRFYGYEGFRCHEIAYGTRQDGAVIKAWGDWADSLWREIASYAHNVTRLDLCVDVMLETPEFDLAKHGFSVLETVSPTRSFSLVTSSDGGQTLYVGSRASDKFGRLYDKGVESKTAKPGYIWRYEVEAKGKWAYEISRQLLGLFYDDQISAMGSMVHSFFANAHVPVIFPNVTSFYVPRPAKVPLAGEEILEWLRVQVRPSVQRLVALGGAEKVMDALGLL